MRKALRTLAGAVWICAYLSLLLVHGAGTLLHWVADGIMDWMEALPEASALEAFLNEG
jgi:hypothetical protein